MCGKPKECVALLGAAGDRLAKEMGYADGEMPMHAKLPGDMGLCPECMAGKVQFIEMDGGKPTGRWLVPEESLRASMKPGALLDSVLESRKALVTAEDAASMFGEG